MDKDKEEEEHGVFYTFLTETSLHGVGNAASAGWSPRRFFWMFWVIFGFGFATYQIYLTFEIYLQFNVNTEISLVYERRLAFPAVSICNFNKYRRSKMSASDLQLVSWLSFADSYDYEADYSDGDLGDDFSKDDLSYDDESFSLKEFTDNAGFNLSDSLMSCYWQGKDCTASHFTKVYTSLGLCYTFNADLDETKYQDQPGAGNGLHVTINVQQDEYSEKYETGNLESGLKFLVHNQKDPPLMDSQGSAVSPGFHAFVGVRRINAINLPLPWGGSDCEDGNTLERYEDYSLNACFSECKAQVIVDECGCLPLRYPYKISVDDDTPECALSEMSDCVKDTLQNVKQGLLGSACTADCLVPCNLTTYQTTISYASVPNESVDEDLQSALGNFSENDFSRNIILLDVYYEELNFMSYLQSKAMTWDTLLGNIGGQLGLFLGASVLTFFEFMEFFLIALVSLIKSKKVHASNNNNDKVELKNRALIEEEL